MKRLGRGEITTSGELFCHKDFKGEYNLIEP